MISRELKEPLKPCVRQKTVTESLYCVYIQEVKNRLQDYIEKKNMKKEEHSNTSTGLSHYLIRLEINVRRRFKKHQLCVANEEVMQHKLQPYFHFSLLKVLSGMNVVRCKSKIIPY